MPMMVVMAVMAEALHLGIKLPENPAACQIWADGFACAEEP
jgi:hypothetical protein